MAKDYSKIKALAQSILECIGDEPEGEDGTGVSHKDSERGDQGQTGIADMGSTMDSIVASPGKDTGEKHKKRDDDEMALLASTLASKFNK